jgi:hypothetical protein
VRNKGQKYRVINAQREYGNEHRAHRVPTGEYISDQNRKVERTTQYAADR